MTGSRWRPRAATDLPDGVILFDGVCILCSGWVQFVVARDPAARFRFLAIQSPAGQAMAARLGIDAEDPETNALVWRGQAWFKADAALLVLGSLRWWRWVWCGFLLPRPFRNWLYDRVARNRYRLFGRRDSCMMPDTALQRHFYAG